MNFYEEPKFRILKMYEDIIATSTVEDEDGLVDNGSGDGDGSGWGSWATSV